MASKKCTTHFVRTFLTDLSLQPTITTNSRRVLYPSRSHRNTIRYASSSAPRNQSAEVSNPLNSETSPDFLGIYNQAKQNPDKAALSSWGASWKPETDFSSIKGHSTRLNQDATATTTSFSTAESNEAMGFDFLDDFTSSSASAEETKRDLNSSVYEDEVDVIPTSIRRGFPTRSRIASAETSLTEEEESRAEYDIPWEDGDNIQEKMRTNHDGDENAWKEWDTPRLWRESKIRERIMSRKMANGMGGFRSAPPAATAFQSSDQIKPTIRTNYSHDTFKETMGVYDGKKGDKDKPRWLIEKEAVKGKLKGGRWNPFGRLSPAAVATLKQLKKEHPGMTVEEYAPMFKMSPDAVRRILRSKWEPTAEEEKKRMEKWRKRGDTIWTDWVEKGLVETKVAKKERKQRERRKKETQAANIGGGILFRQRLNLKNRIL